MARPLNTVGTVTLTISTSQRVKSALEALTKTGFFGKNAAETAERIVSQRIWELAQDNKIPDFPNFNESKSDAL
jgi:hypothetical protein